MNSENRGRAPPVLQVAGIDWLRSCRTSEIDLPAICIILWAPTRNRLQRRR